MYTEHIMFKGPDTFGNGEPITNESFVHLRPIETIVGDLAEIRKEIGRLTALSKKPMSPEKGGEGDIVNIELSQALATEQALIAELDHTKKQEEKYLVTE